MRDKFTDKELQTLSFLLGFVREQLGDDSQMVDSFICSLFQSYAIDYFKQSPKTFVNEMSAVLASTLHCLYEKLPNKFLAFNAPEDSDEYKLDSKFMFIQIIDNLRKAMSEVLDVDILSTILEREVEKKFPGIQEVLKKAKEEVQAQDLDDERSWGPKKEGDEPVC